MEKEKRRDACRGAAGAIEFDMRFVSMMPRIIGECPWFVKSEGGRKACRNYSIPVLPKVKVVLIGGVGYYHARMSQTVQTLTLGAFDGQSGFRKTMLNASGGTAGMPGGAVLEYRIGPLFSLSAEAQWRYAKIIRLNGEWSGEESCYDSNGDLISSTVFVQTRGHLYHYYTMGKILERARYTKK